jgi:hypothetical protein
LSNLKKEELVNPVNDVELIKFKYENTKNNNGTPLKHLLTFGFNPINQYTAPASFRNVFSDKETVLKTLGVSSNFYIGKNISK